MDAILKVVLPPLAAMLTVILKISNGDIDSSANPTFFFWLKVGPAVISLLVIILIIVIIFPFRLEENTTVSRHRTTTPPNYHPTTSPKVPHH